MERAIEETDAGGGSWWPFKKARKGEDTTVQSIIQANETIDEADRIESLRPAQKHFGSNIPF